MDMLPVIQAYIIAQGSHTGGHFAEANRQDVPMKLDMKKLSEDWNQDKISKKDATDIHGKGFEFQDLISSGADGKTREDVSKINALIKAFYLVGGPQIFSKLDGTQGDIKEMQKFSGNKYVPHMIGLTALSDLLQTKDSKNSLGFVVNNGQPGLVWNRRF
jgi:hypothetical protein